VPEKEAANAAQIQIDSEIEAAFDVATATEAAACLHR
jgi:hypothetical protein